MMMFRHCWILSGQAECLLCLFVLPHTITENSQSHGNSKMIPPGQSQQELAVKNHPTLPPCLASGFHLQTQVGFEGNRHFLHRGEGFGFLWLHWVICGTTVRGIDFGAPLTSRSLSQNVAILCFPELYLHQSTKSKTRNPQVFLDVPVLSSWTEDLSADRKIHACMQ